MKLLGIIKKSIRFQIVGSVTVVLAIVVLFISLFYPSKQREISINTSLNQVRTLSEMLAFSVGMGLGESNFELVQTTFKWAQQDKNVVYILIQDENDNEIVSYNPDNAKVEAVKLYDKDRIIHDDNNITTYSTIKYKESVLGKIILGYSLEEVNNTIAEDSLFSIVVSLIIFAVGIFLILWMTKIIVKKINKLNNAAKEVAAGNLNVEVDVESEDEVGDLASSFRKMTESIRDANKMLVKEKESISLKVEEAVRESEKQKEYLSENIDKILHEMNKFAEGDLTVNLESDTQDEIGKLFNGFNKSVSNIRQLLQKVTEAITATASASSQISSSIEEGAAGIQEQSSQTNEVATAVEEMTRTILDTTKNATTASENAKRAGIIAGEGGRVVEDTVEGMKRIAEVVSQAAETIKQLGNSSDQIGEIIQVIDDIADQTNLLALNAAIEAARAGEMGRGFAVVADEVRKLAERTTKATKEIANMIKQIQKDTGDAVQSIEVGTEEVQKGRALANRAGDSLKEIIAASNKVVDDVNQVASASEEQSATAEQISKSVETISNVTNESAAGMQQISRAAEDMNYLTNNLQNLISKFKIESDHKFSRKQNQLIEV